MLYFKNTIFSQTFLLLFLSIFSSFAFAVSAKGVSPLLQQPAPALKTFVLFYSKQCPHCAYVLDYIKDNHLDKKYTITTKEISADQGNHGEFVKTLKACLSANKANKDVTIELPVLWDGIKCLYGAKVVLPYLGYVGNVKL